MTHLDASRPSRAGAGRLMLPEANHERAGDGEGMSDTAQGHGWWLASDGKWYPPEAWTGSPPQMGQVTYGAPYPMAHAGPPQVARQNNGLAVASLVCACAGIVPFFFGVPCILGVIFGFVSRGQIKRSQGTQTGDGLALAGIIVGFSLIALFILGVALLAAFGHGHFCTSDNSNFNCTNN
jgi:hypothetical protein